MATSLIELVDELQIHNAINSKSVKDAFLSVPRNEFMASELRDYSFIDSSYPIGDGATISQPSTIAIMLEMLDLKEGQKVLEVGSGSGYVLALINKITKTKVTGVEINPRLVKKSNFVLNKLNIDAEVFLGNGKLGVKENNFDRIIVSASAPKVPTNLFNFLSKNGKLLAPIGINVQDLILFDKSGKEIYKTEGFLFVRLQ